MARAIPQNRRRTLLPAAFADALRQRLIELSGIGVFAAALLIGAALATYSPSDPSLNNATGNAVGNVLGLPGAIVADLAWQFFGLAGWAAPLVLVAWVWRLAGRKLLSLVWFRLLAVIAGMLALSVAAAPLPAPGDWPLRAGMGGASGDVLTGLVLGWLPAGSAGGGWAVIGAGVLLSIGLLGFAAGLDRTEWAYMWGIARRGGGLARRWAGGIARVPKDVGERVEPRLAAEPAPMGEFGGELGDEYGPGDGPGEPPARRKKPKSVVEPRKPKTRAGKRARGCPPGQSGHAGGRYLPGAAPRPPGGAAGERRQYGRQGRPVEERQPAGIRPRRFRRPRRDRQGAPGPRRHPLRTRARARHQDFPGDRPRGRHRALHVGALGAHRRGPRPQRHRHRAAQRPAGDGLPARTARLQRLRAQRRQPDPGARQGYRRRPDDGRPRPHAAPADRRHHRLGQVGGHQHHDPVAALPAVAGSVQIHHDRPEDARTVGL